MSDVRKVVARLFPHGCNMDGGGRGGIPELTPSDIAAALGMVRNTLGRELFCAMWWQDGMRQTMEALNLSIRQLQLAELVRRMRMISVARLGVEVAAESADGTHGNIHGMRRAHAHARAELAEAQQARWPDYGPRYGQIRAAVLSELSAPKHCSACAGRGHLRTGQLTVTCTRCAGSGRGNANTSQRSKLIKISRKNFEEKKWGDVYEWTFRLCGDAEQAAVKELRERLE